MWDQLDATNGDLLLISIISTCFGHLYAHRRENRLRSTACGCLSCYSCCDAGESGGELCSLCAECCLAGNILHTVHTSCHPTLQHHNSYNRTDNYRQWNADGSPDDGHKDARNMLRYYWLPINHYLLHLVGQSFKYFYSPPSYLVKLQYDLRLAYPAVRLFSVSVGNQTAISVIYSSTTLWQ